MFISFPISIQSTIWFSLRKEALATAAFLFRSGDPSLSLYDRDSHTNAFKISGDMLPLNYGVTNKMPADSFANALRLCTSSDMAKLTNSYEFFVINPRWIWAAAPRKEYWALFGLLLRTWSFEFDLRFRYLLTFFWQNLIGQGCLFFCWSCSPFKISLWVNQ